MKEFSLNAFSLFVKSMKGISIKHVRKLDRQVAHDNPLTFS